ncbi:mannosyltransferase [Coelomomyces lativittatus]|nr:mannosyltransferase [Coelomomyces lativittatus]
MKCGGVAVLVVGDLSRSPRMQYHAFSLTQMGIPVDLIGHQGDDHPSTLHTHWVDETVPNPLLRIHSLPTLPSLPRYFFIFFAPLKLLFQCVFLLWILLIKIDHPSHLLVQNPPSLPTLMVAQWVCWIRGTKLIIDWHNLGYSILALKLGESSIYVKIARWLEWYYGHQADGHLCVTQAMQRFLKDTFQVNGPAVVLYDRPQENFRKLTLKEKQIFLHDRLQDQFPTLRQFRINQDMLFITSTSWTADEDFDLLLDTLYQFHDQLLNLTSFQGHVYVIITGKGPLRGFYERAIGHMKFERVHVMTGWLRVEDYPCILGRP